MSAKLEDLEVLGGEAALALARASGEASAVPIEARAEEIRRIAEEERADLEEWFADDGTPTANYQNDTTELGDHHGRGA
jgi:hypothetical protein